MSYEQLVDFMANSQLEGKSIVFEGEVANAFIAVTDKEKLSTDVEAACERIKAERESHKENNTPEYQDAKRAYDELVAKYAELLLNTGISSPSAAGPMKRTALSGSKRRSFSARRR